MILLVCGGRDFDDYQKLDYSIRTIGFLPSLIIEGGARGADRLARIWAINNSIHYAEVPALWDKFKMRAGPLRNNVMLSLRPEYCLAMPGGNGTEDMVRKCIDAGITVWRPYGD